MTEQALLRHLARRHAKAAGFIADPSRWKVCNQCWSICCADAPVCHVCKAYRFDWDRAWVCEVARMIGRNPFPVTAGVVPRLDCI